MQFAESFNPRHLGDPWVWDLTKYIFVQAALKVPGTVAKHDYSV